jgi:ubiquinone/menaquinone biosynthesis C-methylase UbiE
VPRPLVITLGHWAVAKLRDREEDFYLGDPVGYERVVDLFDSRRTIAGIYAELVASHFAPERPALILDQACGTGILTERLARVAVRVVGLDMSTGMLEMARRKEIANAEFREGDFHDLGDFEDGSVDAVTQFAASRYISDPDRYHAELARVLAPGGVAVISYYDTRGKGDELLAFAERCGLTAIREAMIPRTLFLRVGRFVGYADRRIFVFNA